MNSPQSAREVASLTDQELAEFMALTPEEAARIIPNLMPLKRATYERMAQLCDDIALWQSGAGPKPDYAILCHDHTPKDAP